MSSIRRQSIISSLVIYIGFAIGMMNLYFFGTRFTTAQYGLTNMFINIASVMMAFAGLAMPSYVYKFFPYYNDHVPPKKNDQVTLALLISSFGFIIVVIAGWLLKSLVIRKFGANSPELVEYYSWIFPMALGLTVFAVLEAYAWSINKPVLTNLLKEVEWRLITTVLITLFIFRIITDFDLFIKLFAFGYPAIAITLLAYLIIKNKIHFTFQLSKVTRRYFKKMLTFAAFVYSSSVVFTLSQVFDSIVIASALDNGMAKAGIFGLATIMTSIIQAPQRAIISTSLPRLSRAWKSKDIPLIQKIYQRSSINLLLFACAIFLLIALNYREAIETFGLNRDYLFGFNAFLLLGMTRVVDMGTGVNTEIIGTSNFWRFQLFSGVILLVLMLPLTYILTKKYDIIGPAIANLISISVYNAIRVIFLYRKFKLFPFTLHSVYVLVVSGACYAACHLLFNNLHGFGGLIIRTIVFLALYGATVFYLKISPDVPIVVATLKKRLGMPVNEK